MSERCPSCGEEYANHLGLIGTCYRLQEAIGVVGELETKIDRLTAEVEKWQSIAQQINTYWIPANQALAAEVERLKENIKHEIDVDQIRVNLELELGALKSKLSRYEAGMEVETVAHTRGTSYAGYDCYAEIALPMEMANQRVIVLVMKKEDGDE